MKSGRGDIVAWIVALVALLASRGDAADLLVLTPESIEEAAPSGKGAGAILGDYALQNGQVVAIVGNPRSLAAGAGSAYGETATGGRLLDLSRRGKPNDLLHLFEIVAPLRMADPATRREGLDALRPRPPTERQPIAGQRVVLAFPTAEPFGEVRYILEDGWPYIVIEMRMENRTPDPMSLDDNAWLTLAFIGPRGDRPLHMGACRAPQVAWVYDPWYGQAYGVMSEDSPVGVSLVRRVGARERVATTEPEPMTLAAGQSATIRRLLITGGNVFDVLAVARDVAKIQQHRVRLRVTDRDGGVNEADVAALRRDAKSPQAAFAPSTTQRSAAGPGEKIRPAAGASSAMIVLPEDAQLVGAARTGKDGWVELALEPGPYELRVQAPARGPQTVSLDVRGNAELMVEVERAGYVDVTVVDERNKPIGCRVEFIGEGGTRTPFFFPDGGEERSRNTVRATAGKVRQALSPGQYKVLARSGPSRVEAFESIAIRKGADVTVKLVLRPTPTTQAASPPVPATAPARGGSSIVR